MPTATTAANSAAVTSSPPSSFADVSVVRPPSLFSFVSSLANELALESFTRHLLPITRLHGSWRHMLVQGWEKVVFVHLTNEFYLLYYLFSEIGDLGLMTIWRKCVFFFFLMYELVLWKMERSIFVIWFYIYYWVNSNCIKQAKEKQFFFYFLSHRTLNSIKYDFFFLWKIEHQDKICYQWYVCNTFQFLMK